MAVMIMMVTMMMMTAAWQRLTQVRDAKIKVFLVQVEITAAISLAVTRRSLPGIRNVGGCGWEGRLGLGGWRWVGGCVTECGG